MILENYNDSLEENVESERSFTVSECPILRVRPFDSMQYSDEDFILPYFVDNFLNTGYNENKLTNTFTVVVSLDEDTKSEEEIAANCRWKQTTYSGEQIINLGKLEQGEHILSIKAIEDTGIASATRFFKFYVSKPRNEINLMDFTATDTFTVSSKDTEKRVVPYWYITPDDGNGGGYFPVLLHYDKVTYQNNNENHIPCYTAKITRDLTYTVTFNRNSNDTLTGIDIEVHGTISIPPHTFDGHTHQGFQNENAIRLDGIYHITDSVEINGDIHLLRDYLSSDPSSNPPYNAMNPPAKATYTAARNKIGLKFLLWACKAYCNKIKDNQNKSYDGVILPTYEYIVSYANGLDCSDQDVIDVFANESHYNYTIEPKSITAINDGHWLRNDIEFPNNIIIDFNYSSIKSLALNVHSGRLVTIFYGRLTELRNLEVVGDYAQYYRLDGGIDETKGGVKLHHCVLCTLNNINISRTAGYELIGNGISHTSLNVSTPEFTEYGYINYEGNTVTVPLLKTDSNSYLNNNDYFDVNWENIPLEHVDALVQSISDTSAAHTQNQVEDDSISNVMYTGGNPFSLGGAVSSNGVISDNYEGAFHISNTDSTYGYNISYGDSNYRHRFEGDNVFVSFYKKVGNNYQFIKTVKMEIWDIGYIPYGATHAKLSAIGSYNKSACLISRLNRANEAKSVFRFSSPLFMRRANRLINCKVHDVRTTIITVLGHQTYTENLITYNAASEKGGRGEVTALLCDIEDNSMHTCHAWFKGWYNWYGPPGHAVLTTKQGCNDVCFIESSGFTSDLDTKVKDGFYAQSTLSVNLFQQNTCVVRKEFQFRNNAFNNIKIGKNPTTPKTEYYLKDCTTNSIEYSADTHDDDVIVKFI